MAPDDTPVNPEDVLRVFDVLEAVGSTAHKLPGEWEARVLPVHGRLERLCADAAEPTCGGDKKVAQAAADERAEVALLAVGACAQFIERSAAAVDVATHANGSADSQAAVVLGGAVRVLLAELLTRWLRAPEPDRCAKAWAADGGAPRVEALFPVGQRVDGMGEELGRRCVALARALWRGRGSPLADGDAGRQELAGVPGGVVGLCVDTERAADHGPARASGGGWRDAAHKPLVCPPPTHPLTHPPTHTGFCAAWPHWRSSLACLSTPPLSSSPFG